ncbi:MAG: zinc ribbon domain-containing protein, partial [Vicinamibacterales bacterium]
ACRARWIRHSPLDWTMSSGTSTKKAEPDAEPFLQPWQFFLLGGMLAATATVIVATGQSAASIIILSLTVVAVSFVGLGAYRMLLPLVSSSDVETPMLIGGRTRIALEREKQLVLRSIKELEFDFAMGKVSNADFDEMNGRLRRRAVGLMRQLDEGGAYREQIEREVERRLKEMDGGEAAVRTKAEASAASEPLICQCGTANDSDARFCKSCGARVATE